MSASAEDLFYAMTEYKSQFNERKEYLLFDSVNFSIRRSKLTPREFFEYENNVEVLLFEYNKKSILELCKLKIYYLGCERHLDLDHIEKIEKIWISWFCYLPISCAISLLRLDGAAIFSNTSHNEISLN